MSEIFTDQLNRTVALPQWPPQRIISLVPSQTELLFDLGLETEVVGITKFCLHPAHWFQEKKRVGGTKTLHFQKIADLKPDLIIGNKEENTREQIEVLAEQYPVWMSDVLDLNSALEMIDNIGKLTNRSAKAEVIARDISTGFAGLAEMVRPQPRRIKVAYLIWRKPFMAAASDTFIQDMLNKAGFDNVFTHLTRYPEISIESLQAAAPDLILLSSEPYPFQEKHIREIQDYCPDSRVMLVDGEMFSWYGSRLLKAAGYLKGLVELVIC